MAQIQISDLIAEAVDKASERRNRAMAISNLSDLSAQEMNQIKGGLISSIYPIILGLFFS